MTHNSENTVKLTKNQTAVLAVLQEASVAMSAYDILDHVREKGIKAPLQVYRALEPLIKYGLVHRLESINAFVSCSQEKCHNSHSIAFMICEECSDIREVSEQFISEFLAKLGEAGGFKARKSNIELIGSCESCQAR